MIIQTRRFGKIEVADEKVLTMPAGLAGFPGRKRFVLLEREETRPFCWFQSADDPNLSLVVMNPLLFKPDYRVELKSAIKEMSWEGDRTEDMAVYVVLTVNENGPYRITANLIGPIVINTGRREAVQLVLYDSRYSIQHPVMEQPQPPRQRAAAG
ncbi:MAG: flagellar assembly protein FliW [Thermodesulfobacteriota bacterium]